MKNKITVIFDDYFLTAKVLRHCCEMICFTKPGKLQNHNKNDLKRI